jgi:AcrR family transcriptional regulator
MAIPDPATLDAAQLERRARIVDAAVGMMLTTEYERIQMRDVTAAAGVALGTTYRYFASKDHLMSEAVLAWAERFPTQPPPSGGSSRERLKLAFTLAVRAFAPHPTAYGAVSTLQGSTDPLASANYAAFASRQVESFERFIPRVRPERRGRIVLVMGAVLDTQLRSWSLGRIPIDDVYRALDDAADLLMGD